MKAYSILIGARPQRRRFLEQDEATLQRITLRAFKNGFTILSAEGAWYDPTQKRFVKQETRQVVVCTDSSATVTAWCRALGEALDQKELIVIALGRARRVEIERGP